MLNRFIVKDKYTFERVWQKDYSYNKDYYPEYAVYNAKLSHNYIPALWKEIDADTIAEGKFSEAKPLEKAVNFDVNAISGFRISVEDENVDDDTIIRVTFFGEKKKQEFSSICQAKYVKENGSICFSTVKMNFKPTSLKLETNGKEIKAKINLVNIWDTLGEWAGQSKFYTATNKATLTDKKGTLVLKLGGNGGFITGKLPQEVGGTIWKNNDADSCDAYNMLMPRRNTIFMVIANKAKAKTATIKFTSTKQNEWSDENQVTIDLAEDTNPHAYYFNFSLCPGCEGRLLQWEFTSEGKGDIEILRYSYEQEMSELPNLVKIKSTKVDVKTSKVTVKGTLDKSVIKDYKGGKLNLYTGILADDDRMGREFEKTGGKTLIKSIDMPEKANFVIENVDFKQGKITLLPYQLLLFAEKDGKAECLGERFTIDNFEDVEKTKFTFKLPNFTVNVLERGAAGDGFTDDTEAIQNAIDEVSEAGGGRVLIPGEEGIYGRRYVITNLLMRDNVDLHLGDGAVLWQSQIMEDYTYTPAFGHDGVIPGINWTHSLHVSNLPLIQAASNQNIKVTGKGVIRSLDVGSVEGVGMPGYAAGCYRRIHCCSIGFFLCDNVELRDFCIRRSNNYHLDASKCRYVSIANVSLHEVKCVSGDGFGVGSSKHVHVNRCYYQSNDDGIVMTVHYVDPRGILWWTNIREEDNSVDDILTTHCYLNSGGGKALAFITWGTNDLNQEREELRNIEAYDNFLMCVNPVGAWYDNPYNGKQPFDNSETDDYSPVKNVRIHDNVYVGNCDLGPIQATNIITDCGIHSASQFQNGNFTLGGLANWTKFPNKNKESVDTVVFCDKDKGRIWHFDEGPVSAAQGLYLKLGKHTFNCELMTAPSGAELYAQDIITGKVIASKKFVCQYVTNVSMTFNIKEEAEDVFVGIRSASDDPKGFALFTNCNIESEVDEEAIKALAMRRFRDKVNDKFSNGDEFGVNEESGKLYLSTKQTVSTKTLTLKKEQKAFQFEAAIQVDGVDGEKNAYGYGFRIAKRDGGKSYRELFFDIKAQLLTLTDVENGKKTEVYRRENFFFTSLSFHIFKLDVGEKETVIWIDGSQYGSVALPAVKGQAEIVLENINVSINAI